jgi:hypothetical protein
MVIFATFRLVSCQNIFRRLRKKVLQPLLLVAAQFRRFAIPVTYRAATTGSGQPVVIASAQLSRR